MTLHSRQSSDLARSPTGCVGPLDCTLPSVYRLICGVLSHPIRVPKDPTSFAMVNGFKLIYLIEGEITPFYINVSYISDGKPTKVEALRTSIFNDDRKSLVRDYNDLTILKINVSPDHPEKPFPLLRFSKEDKGVEELSPEQTMDQIWPEPPPTHQIHVFVKFTSFLPKVDNNSDNFGSRPPRALRVLGERPQRLTVQCARPWRLAVSTTGTDRHSRTETSPLPRSSSC
ncbi:hypothetical protein EDB89DRAFT_360597 [Lactarius sanguifluus]|nr:hypothetical protein EDB89DRAFT_360597 [Lactarius sanguifluus]